MLSSAPVVATLPMVDVARARAFYEEKLGLSPKLDSTNDDHVMYVCGNGTSLFLYHRGPTKADHTAASFQVDDIEATMTELRAKGVVFEDYDLPGLNTENGIATHEEMKSAWFKDSEGNILAITQMAKSV